MSTTSPEQRGRNRRPGNRSAERFVLLGTQVPPEVKKHYTDAAKRHGMSLSRYFERLAAVDPLAHAPIEEESETKKA